MIYEIWDAGNVNRWHANKYPQLRNSQDTVHAHSARVALLMQSLFKADPTDGLVHDLPEKKLGDIPYGAPKGPHYAEAEEAWFDAHNIYTLPTPQLHFCDRLDALLWALQHVPNLLRDPEWDDAYHSLIAQASELGVLMVFNSIMDDVKKLANVVGVI